MTTKIVPVNAETRTDARIAVQREMRKRGIPCRVVSADFADFQTGQLADEAVAVVVTRGQHGETPARMRRTILVTVERPDR